MWSFCTDVGAPGLRSRVLCTPCPWRLMVPHRPGRSRAAARRWGANKRTMPAFSHGAGSRNHPRYGGSISPVDAKPTRAKSVPTPTGGGSMNWAFPVAAPTRGWFHELCQRPPVKAGSIIIPVDAEHHGGAGLCPTPSEGWCNKLSQGPAPRLVHANPS